MLYKIYKDTVQPFANYVIWSIPGFEFKIFIAMDPVDSVDKICSEYVELEEGVCGIGLSLPVTAYIDIAFHQDVANLILLMTGKDINELRGEHE